MGAPGRPNPVRYCGEGEPLRSSSLATASRRKRESNGQKPVEFSKPPEKCTKWPDSLRIRVERVIYAQSFFRSRRHLQGCATRPTRLAYAWSWVYMFCDGSRGQLGAWGRCGSRSCLGHCWRLCGHPALADAAAWHCVTSTGQPGKFDLFTSSSHSTCISQLLNDSYR